MSAVLHRVVIRRFPPAGDPPAPTRTIYCAPAAGTGARTFLVPFARSPVRESLRVVQLPGREDRVREPCMDDIREMAALTAEAIAPGAGDYALFGHSFGAALMLETARRLERIGAPPPALLAVAGFAPPHVTLPVQLHGLTDAEVAKAVQDLGGLEFSGPRADELKARVLPALGADFRALARYLDAPGEGVVATPILAMTGALDTSVSLAELASWRSYTTARFEAREFAGGHFFPLESDVPLRAVADWTP